MLNIFAKQIIFFIYFLFISNSALAEIGKYKHNFAFFCKSFDKDLDKSIKLYLSFEDKFRESIHTPFYFVVPEKDLSIFQKSFKKLLKEGKTSKLPIFLTEDKVLKDCNILHRVQKGTQKMKRGWLVQQMIKMCISQTNIAKDYVTLDSDVYFVKNLDKNFFYHKGHLKIVGRKIGSHAKAIKFFNLRNSHHEDQHRYETATFVRYIFRPKEMAVNPEKLPLYYDFVGPVAPWDSAIMNAMRDYVSSEMNFDFYDLIQLNPWEMQWYGQFIQSKYLDKFNLMGEDFVLILGYQNSNNSAFRCLPENGYGLNYFVANQSELGYKMPNTLFCKIKNKFNYLNIFYLKKFFWNFIY